MTDRAAKKINGAFPMYLYMCVMYKNTGIRRSRYLSPAVALASLFRRPLLSAAANRSGATNFLLLNIHVFFVCLIVCSNNFLFTWCCVCGARFVIYARIIQVTASFITCTFATPRYYLRRYSLCIDSDFVLLIRRVEIPSYVFTIQSSWNESERGY